ncbi:MAG: C45 family autoproteolytic acyltransferase/hydrolase [Candidatus Zipacnadales bacterium]
MTIFHKLLTCLVVSLLALAAVLVTLLSSLRAAPAAGYRPPSLDLSRIRRPEPASQVQHLGQHLSVVNGLRVLHVWGTPEEMGRQHGQALRAEIRAGLDCYMRQRVTEEQRYSREYQRACAQAMLPYIPDEYIREMRAVAEGAGVPYEDILLLHTHADMVHFGHEWGHVTYGRERKVESLCSNFVVFGEATVDGKTYHGRNLDWTTSTGIQQYAILLIAEPKGKIPFALLSWAGAISSVTGMNAEGLTFGEMTSSTVDETLEGMPLFFVCRRILDTCHDLDQVERFVKTYRGTTGWNFVIADGEVGDARAFEVDAKHRVVFRPNDPAEDLPPISWPIPNAIRRTNHPVDHEVQEAVAARAGIAGAQLAIVRAAVPFLDTWQRYASLGYWINEEYRGKIDAQVARAMLQTAPVAGRGNLHSAVFDATDCVLWVANASLDEPAWQQPYVRIDLRKWLANSH